MPKGAIESRTDFGTDGYGGPCPPQGDKPHHYIFTVYAVDEDKLQFGKIRTFRPQSLASNCIFTLRQKGLNGCRRPLIFGTMVKSPGLEKRTVIHVRGSRPYFLLRWQQL